HAQVPRVGVELAQIGLVDVVRERARQLVVKVSRRRDYGSDITVGHPEDRIRKDLIERSDEDDVRRILQAPAPWRATPLQQLQYALDVAIGWDEVSLGVEPARIARDLRPRLEQVGFEVQRLQAVAFGWRGGGAWEHGLHARKQLGTPGERAS